jgi:F-type H+-transporting ATPase subunit g
MLPSLLPRLAARQSRFAIQRRTASTTEAASNAASSGASKAKEGASEAASKAQQGLSRVTSSAGSALSSASTAASNAVSGIGGRTGAAISFVQGWLDASWCYPPDTNNEKGLIPPTIYYARVVGELGKIIYRGRNMQPP